MCVCVSCDEGYNCICAYTLMCIWEMCRRKGLGRMVGGDATCACAVWFSGNRWPLGEVVFFQPRILVCVCVYIYMYMCMRSSRRQCGMKEADDERKKRGIQRMWTRWRVEVHSCNGNWTHLFRGFCFKIFSYCFFFIFYNLFRFAMDWKIRILIDLRLCYCVASKLFEMRYRPSRVQKKIKALNKIMTIVSLKINFLGKNLVNM